MVDNESLTKGSAGAGEQNERGFQHRGQTMIVGMITETREGYTLKVSEIFIAQI